MNRCPEIILACVIANVGHPEESLDCVLVSVGKGWRNNTLTTPGVVAFPRPLWSPSDVPNAHPSPHKSFWLLTPALGTLPQKWAHKAFVTWQQPQIMAPHTLLPTISICLLLLTWNASLPFLRRLTLCQSLMFKSACSFSVLSWCPSLCASCHLVHFLHSLLLEVSLPNYVKMISVLVEEVPCLTYGSPALNRVCSTW